MSRFFLAEQIEGLICADEFCSKRLKFCDGSLSIFKFQSFDRVLHYGHSPSALEQTPGREANTIFCDHAKDDKLRVGI